MVAKYFTVFFQAINIAAFFDDYTYPFQVLHVLYKWTFRAAKVCEAAFILLKVKLCIVYWRSSPALIEMAFSTAASESGLLTSSLVTEGRDFVIIYTLVLSK